MHLDALDLRRFYYRTRLGRLAQSILQQQVARLWPDTTGQCVVGFGFAAPLLRPHLGRASRVIALMPGPQGVMDWPRDGQNVSVLCEDTLWPLGPGSVDRLLVLHGLETSDHPAAVLNECWRVLKPEGRAIFIVPNRGGLWARTDRTPFGYGRPYSLGQLEGQLRRHDFVVEHALSTLYTPPSENRFWRRSSRIWERMGRWVPFLAAGGVLIVEVSKQVAAPRRPGLPEAVARPLRALEGLAKPVPAPAPSPRT